MSMNRRRYTWSLGFVGLVPLAACQHENEAATTGPVVAAPAPTVPSPEGSAATPPPDAATPDDASTPSASPPVVTAPDMSAAPTYPASALYETFSASSARAKLIACYLPGKQRDPKLRGKVIVKFTINADGSAKPVANEGSNLTDDAVINCVVRTIKTLHFQKPVEGSVTVVYPFIFRPTGDETLILPDAGKK
jgi:outer membrane biosynthesis protein TonB